MGTESPDAYLPESPEPQAPERAPNPLDRGRAIFIRAVADGLHERAGAPPEYDGEFDESRGPYALRRMFSENLAGQAEGADSPSVGIERNGMLFIRERRATPLPGSSREIVEETYSVSRGGNRLSRETIVSIRDGSSTFDLNRLLPNGIALEKAPEIGYEDGNAFGEADGLQSVRYSSVASNEGFYSFLHEVAHAWQARSNPTAIESYRYVSRVVRLPARIQLYEDALEQMEKMAPGYLPDTVADEALVRGLSASEMADRMKRYIERTKPFIEKLGVRMSPVKITVDNPSVVERLDDYVWVERHAWSAAARVYRELAREGLVPNPDEEIDLAGVADRALRSYQTGLDFIEVTAARPFVRGDKGKGA